LGVSNPAIIRKRVVLPQPEGPRREKNSPFFIDKSISFKTLMFPNDLETPLMTTSLPFNALRFPPSFHPRALTEHVAT
jgi:hypothetical protein